MKKFTILLLILFTSFISVKASDRDQFWERNPLSKYRFMEQAGISSKVELHPL